MFLFLKENLFKLILIFILLVILVYVVNISSIPESIILFENEEFSLDIIAGLKLEKAVTAGADLAQKISSNIELLSSKSETQYRLSFLGVNLKTITTNTIPVTKVIPLGNLVGLKLYTQGVLVVGMSEIKGEDNKIYKPYEEAGISQGDSIIEINDVKINTTEELIACVSKCKGKAIEVTYLKDGNVLETKIMPVKTSDNIYKIGLWVRDAEAGIGTATFYKMDSESFAALGHGIQDIDTEELVEISSGEFVTAEIVNIDKGEKDNPGKIEGTIEDSKNIGEVYSNTHFGIYGKIDNKDELNISKEKEVDVASRNEIKQGKATIICTLEDGVKNEYEIEIQKIYINNNENNKSMLIKVTDKKLLEKTGGIIQGMSGSPIIQNGKFIGALTHVLVQKPDTGYAVFADLMIREMKMSEYNK